MTGVQNVENPPTAGIGGLNSEAFPAKEIAQTLPQKPKETQAICLEMLQQSLADDIEMHVAQLDAAVAMLRAGSNAGYLHGIRCGQAYWNAIKSAAKELASKAEGKS